MSEHPDYRAATRRGILPDRGGGVEFAEPERLRLFVHPTPAGSVAVIVAGARVDFERLVQALTRRNEPDVIPASMGACIVAGYNNWERVQRLRGEWESNNPGVCDGAAWANEFQRIVPRKALYQDRFIVLSSGPYSATPWESTGLSEAEWTDASVTIRLEHECAHYFTKRVLGSMQNSLVDELIADYCGLVTATGRVRGEWLLHFMGLEAYPVYREGGRLQNYRGKPPLTDRAFAVLQSMYVQAAKNLERFDAARCEFQNWQSLSHRAQTIVALAGAGLERLASNANPFTMATVKRQHSPLDRTRANDKMGQRLSNVLVPIRNL